MIRFVRQTESAECALACLAMIASSYGQNWELGELRGRFSTSLKGAALNTIADQATRLGFTTRAIRLELDELSQLRLPCILHWNMNHFVVLVRVGRKHVVIADPANRVQKILISDLSVNFTGVALELMPMASFEKKEKPAKLSLAQLTGSVRGLTPALVRILGVSFALEMFALAGPLFNQLVVDDALASSDRNLITVLSLGFGILLVAQTAISLARSWMVMVLGQAIAVQWMGNMLAHLIRLPLSFFEKRHLGDISSRFSSVSAIQRTLTTSVIEALLDGIMAIAALIMMTMYAPALTLISIGAVLIYGCLRWISYNPLREAASQRLVLAARENSYFLETLRAIAPLKLFGREDQRRARWLNLVVDVQNRDVKTAKLNIVFSTANTFVFGVEGLLVMSIGAQIVLSSQTAGQAIAESPFTVGMLLAYLGYRGQFTGRISALINYGIELKMLGLHAERLADIALHPREKHEQFDPKISLNVPDSDLSHLEPTLEIKSVSFRYGEGEPWILKDANFTVFAGSHVAITGLSGSGKSTLLKILLGLLEPTEGAVYFGGIPFAQLGVANVRNQLGTVMQEDVLLTGSLFDNVTFFDEFPDRQRVDQCIALAHVAEDISRMPMGLQTRVGDLGSGLSGGQKQRLLLARALYKRPRILALDEATSHLDTTNERSVTNSLSQMQLTRLTIAHRPETIAGAQRVVELRDGQIFEVVRVVHATGLQLQNVQKQQI